MHLPRLLKNKAFLMPFFSLFKNEGIAEEHTQESPGYILLLGYIQCIHLLQNNVGVKMSTSRIFKSCINAASAAAEFVVDHTQRVAKIGTMTLAGAGTGYLAAEAYVAPQLNVTNFSQGANAFTVGFNQKQNSRIRNSYNNLYLFSAGAGAIAGFCAGVKTQYFPLDSKANTPKNK